MSHDPHLEVNDATLVAWLDGELDGNTSSTISRRVTRSHALGERVRLLRSARSELHWALTQSETAPPPAQLAGTAGTRPSSPLVWLVAAAAAIVVAAVMLTRDSDDDDATAAANEQLAVKLTMPRPGWDIFTDIRFTLSGRSKTDVPCRMLSRGRDETDAQLVARAQAAAGDSPFVPIVLDADLTGPGRQVLGRIAGVDATFAQDDGEITFRLTDLRTRYDGIAPLLAVKLQDNGASEDFDDGIRRGVRPSAKPDMGFLPEEVGGYRLRLRLRALPLSADSEPGFAKPLEVAIGFAVRGVVGDWSEPVDGMRARIVASRARSAVGQPLAIALQLRNDSDRARRYNLTGSTIAEIPQPFHFTLRLDDKDCEQREDLAVMTVGQWSFLGQPEGTVRTAVVLTDYWRVDGKPPSQLRGEHQLGMRFDFKPSVWTNNDKTLWMGKIDVPAIRITIE